MTERQMAEKGWRSKFSTCPGSITAIRVDYGRTTSAFDTIDSETATGKKRDAVKRWKQARNLGVQPEWDESTANSWQRFPERAKMRELSSYQATKVDYNYRAQTLPTCYKDTVFLPKSSKFEVDPSLFLSEKEKGKMVSTCPGGHLSRSEFTDVDRKPVGVFVGQPKEGPAQGTTKTWNASTSLERPRASVHYKEKQPLVSIGTINQVKCPPPRSYLPPHKTVARTNRLLRTQKEDERKRRKAEAQEPCQMPFTLSNKSQWMSLPNIHNVSPTLPEKEDSSDSDDEPLKCD